MFATERLGLVENICRGRLVRLDWYTIQVRDERMREFGRSALSPFPGEQRVQNLMPPEGRYDHRVANGDSL